MTRQELSAALDQLESYARAASSAQTKPDYSAAALQAVVVRSAIRSATLDRSLDLILFTELAYLAERSGDDTELDQSRLALRNSTLR